MNKVLHGDCLEEMKKLPDNSVDAIITDPPYELGFMGKSWDSTGIANDKEMWAECLRVLKPGGHLLAFSGTRTYHRMASAIEDAGFEVRDMIEWVYGSGFPKSLNIGKAVDKLRRGNRVVELIDALLEKGHTIKELGEKSGIPSLESSYRDWTIGGHKPEERSWDRMLKGLGFSESDGLNIIEKRTVSLGGGNAYTFREGEKRDWEMKITKGTSEWEGWGTALKPAHEPICMARKPLAEKTVAENCLKYGTGGINIDESRVSTDYYLQGNDLSDIISIFQLNHLQSSANNAELKKFQDDTTSVIKNLFSVAENVDMPILEKTLGRLQEDTTRMDIQCYEGMLEDNISTSLNMYTLGRNIVEQSRKDLKYIISTVLKMITDWKIYNVSAYQLTEVLLTKAKNEVNTREKSGRFPANLLHDNSEEVRGCFPESTSGAKKANQKNYNHEDKEFVATLGASVNEYQASSGNASRFFKSIIYQAKASKSNRGEGNNHATVKPTALMEYLINMVSREGQTILDPFGGSGTTAIACLNTKRNYILIEKEKEYIDIIHNRIAKHT